MHKLARLDHQYIWHPFTQMRDWLRREPITIISGKGSVLCDVHGRKYLDANASIWTNLHGHNHPVINTAIRRQLGHIAHSSALGLANEPASLLAEKLIQAANPQRISECCGMNARSPKPRSSSPIRNPKSASHTLAKVFYSDDGSTAMEVALKLAYEYARRTGRARQPRFLSLAGAYHGDSVGAVSLGHIDLFHKSYAGLLFKTDSVMAPYCYRCPFNRAKPERADARVYRQCHWECVDRVEHKFVTQRKRGNPYAAMVVEPLIQGAAGMIPQPQGWLERVTEIIRSDGALFVADEVMTGFGRTGVNRQDAFMHGSAATTDHSCQSDNSDAAAQTGLASLFACHKENVQPDLMAVSKGLTGGYMPLAATLTSQALFDAFLGDYSEFKTFFHGHSYTSNQLGCAAALANMELLDSPASVRARQKLVRTLHDELQALWSLPHVGDIRQVGLIAGVELVRDWRTRQPYDPREKAGIRVAEGMIRRGVLMRPIGSVMVLMPPYCTSTAQLRQMANALRNAIEEFSKHDDS